MSANVYCIYHKNCNDGMAALWALSQFETITQSYPMDYGDPMPEIPSGGTVYIVDFSLSGARLAELTRKHDRVVVMDHHISAINRLVEYFDLSDIRIPTEDPDHHKYRIILEDRLVTNPLELYLDTTQSGAGIVWRHFASEDELPWVVKYTEDYDLWKFEYGETTQAVSRWLQALPTTLSIWDRYASKSLTENIIDDGNLLLMSDDRHIEWHLENATRWINFRGIFAMCGIEHYDYNLFNRVPLVNVPKYLASRTLHRLVDGDKVPLAMGYHDDAEHRVFRLCTPKDGVAINSLAEQLGGGGHPHAAGLRIERDHFLAAL